MEVTCWELRFYGKQWVRPESRKGNTKLTELLFLAVDELYEGKIELKIIAVLPKEHVIDSVCLWAALILEEENQDYVKAHEVARAPTSNPHPHLSTFNWE